MVDDAPKSDGLTAEAIDAFIARWRESGGMEIANTQTFLNEFCDLLSLPRPDPSKETTALNDYVFERNVIRRHGDDTTSTRRIDLYKRGCFVLEAKQGSDGGGSKKANAAQSDMFGAEAGHARAGTAKRGTQGWVMAMRRARAQAEAYAKDLPPEHGWPPFLIVADIGYCFEIYADFSGQGKAYEQFPDRRGFRVLLEDLHDADVRDRLRAIWTDPKSLDPSRRSAEATRDIAARLAKVARELEKKHAADTVAHFLMRCLFAMFAEDTGLLKPDSFTKLLSELRETPDKAHIALEALFREMDTGTALSGWLREPVRRFNGGLFRDARALPLTAEMVSELHIAAKRRWTDVEPAIFGTLLEQALDKKERHRLGAHYTPRAYVDRLVTPAIIEPLREDWAVVQAEIQALLDKDDAKKALARLRAFHAQLCETRVLDPACGTGNFLYVAMERMKRLEGEVVDMIVELGGKARAEYRDHTIDPHQFLGIEINPRAAAIAELVLWIGYIQWQVRSGGIDFIYDPVLRDFHNIEHRDALLDYDEKRLRRDEDGKPVTRWDGETMKLHPVTGEEVPDEAARVEVHDYLKPRAADWPEADFIVGNPPFIGSASLRSELGDGYAEALWATYPAMPRSADFVMYWWHKAADRLAKGAGKKGDGKPRRFGFITTNSIRQTFNRRVVEAGLGGKPPLSLVFAIPDHPWMKSADRAAVRIAMTVAAPGEEVPGMLATSVSETDLNTDDPQVELDRRTGVITPMLRIGAAVGSAKPLKANVGLAIKGFELGTQSLLLSNSARESLVNKDHRIASFTFPYLNGNDLKLGRSTRHVIDLQYLDRKGISAIPVLEAYLLDFVVGSRNPDAEERVKTNWWKFRRSGQSIREALDGLPRFIATTRTAKHRVFQMLNEGVYAESKIVIVASSSHFILTILSSRIHMHFSTAAGGFLGVGNDPTYNHTDCFDPFPFPDLDGKPDLKAELDELGERLDAFRKERLEAYDFLTMTKLYNVLERVRALEAKTDDTPLSDSEKDIYEAGLVGVLKDIHDRIDAAVFKAYGWPADLDEEAILQRLVDLNHERAAEEARGHIRWLRPDFQNPTGRTAEAEQDKLIEADLPAALVAAGKSKLPSDAGKLARAVRYELGRAGQPLTAAETAALFDGKNTKAKIAKVEGMLSILTAVGQAEMEKGRYYAGG